ncbi:MAG: hypothetical protein AAF493_21455 [Pseudomonadota bacterium]
MACELTSQSTHPAPWVVILATQPMRHGGFQFRPVADGLSIVEQTCVRALQLTTPDRLVTVVTPEQWRDSAHAVEAVPGKVMVAPQPTGELADVFLPLGWIVAQDPEASVLVLPSDHFMEPADDFVRLLHRAVGIANDWPSDVFFLGAEATEPCGDYQWLAPGDPLSERNLSVRRIRKIYDAKTYADQLSHYRAGHLWHTRMIAMRASALWEHARICVPELVERLDAVRVAASTAPSANQAIDDTIAQIFDDMPAIDFDQALWRPIRSHAAVIPMIGITWTDWSRPERILEALPPAPYREVDDVVAEPLESDRQPRFGA